MTNARRNLRRLLYLLAVVVGLVILLHAPFVQRAVRSRIETELESRLGARATVDELHYRLWLGELRATGIVLTSGSWSARADQVLVLFSPWSGISVQVDSPVVHVTRSILSGPSGPSGSSGPSEERASPFSLPPILLRSHVTLVNGSFFVDNQLELDSIQAELVPGLVGADAEITVARGTFQGPWRAEAAGEGGPAGAIAFGPLTGRLRLGSREIEIEELRAARNGSFVNVSGELDSLSPLTAELQYRLHLDAALLRELDPRLELSGEIEDEGKVSRAEDGSLTAEGLARSDALRFREVSAAVRAPWRLGDGVLTIQDASVEAFGGNAEVDAVLNLAAGTESVEVSFEGVDATTATPWVASRASGKLTVSLERFELSTASGEGRVSLTPATRPARRSFPVRGEAQVRIVGERIVFTARNLSTPSLSVDASGAWEKRLTAHYRARVRDLADAREIYEALDVEPPPFPVSGALLLEGDATETTKGFATRAEVTSEELRLGQLPVGLSGGVEWRDGRLEVHGIRLASEATEEPENERARRLELDGGIPTDARSGPWDLSAQAQELDLSWISAITSEATISGSLTGTLTLKGDFESPALEASWEANGVTVDDVVRGALAGEAHLRGLRPAEAFGESGARRAEALGGGGLFASLVGEATLRGKDLFVRDVPFPGESYHFTFDHDHVRIAGRLDDGRELLSGTLSLEAPYLFAVEVPLASLPFLEARELFPRLRDAGTELELEGSAALTGALSDLGNLRYRIEVERVFGFYRGLVLGATSPFTLVGDLDRFEVQDLTLVGEDTAIGVEGIVPLSHDGGVFLHARGATRLELLRPWVPSLEPAGRADVEVRVEGALPDPWIRGDIEIEDGSAVVSGVRVENVLAEVVWTDEALSVESLSGEVLGGTLQIHDASFPSGLRAGGAVRASFEAVDLDPLRLLPEDSALPPDTETRVGLRGEVSGEGFDPSTWSGEGSIERVSAGARGFSLESDGPARWNLERGALSLQVLRLAGGATKLTVDADARPFDDPPSWRAHATGRLDHSVASVVLQDLGWIFTGATELDVRAGQGPGPFFIEGHGSFSNARLVIRDPAITFTNVGGEIALTGDRITLTSLQADAGGGRVEANGEITLEDARIDHIDLKAQARSVRLSYPEGLRSEVDGDFRLAGDSDRLRLSGEVTLGRALFSRDINVETELLQSLSRVRGVAPEEGFASSVTLDLRVRATDALRIDNNLARMEASVNLTVGGTLAAPEIDGIASARPGGNFRFGGRSYRVETGRIQLRGYPNEPPVLDITAVTSVSAYDIRLTLRGPTDDLVTELSSENHPELSRGDLASLLLTGRTLGEISGEGRTVVGEQMVSYLGATLADLAQLGIGETLPFDIVTVEPSLIAGEADPGARFTLGARFTNALSLVYSVSLNNADDQIWLVDYELPRRTRAQMIRDEQNDFTFGLAQELRLARASASRVVREARSVVSAVDISLPESAPPEVRAAVQERLHTKAGDRFDYWSAWEDAERLRSELRERGYLEARVDVTTEPREAGQVGVRYVIDLGPPVRFVFRGDEVTDGIRKALTNAWNGDSSETFLTNDLTVLAEGKLYADRYFSARVEVSSEMVEAERVVTVSIDRGPKGRDLRVHFVGNDSVADSVLLGVLPKPRSAAFHELLTSKRPRLKQLLRLEYASRGFVSASIGDPETSSDPSGDFTVTIPVSEGPRYLVDAIDLEGVRTLDEETLRSRLTLHLGEPFRVTDFVRDRSALASYYRDQGFPDVSVEASVLDRPQEAALGVRFAIEEGPQVRVGAVEVAGNETTRERLIRREVSVEPGEPLRLSELGATQRRLYELGIFQSAEVVVDPDKAGGAVRDVKVEVTEAPRLELDYGGRISTDGLFQALGEVRAPNLFGWAQHAGFRALVGTDRKTFRFNYHSPFLSGYRIDTDFFVERDLLYQGPQPLEGDPTQETLPFHDRTWTFTAQQTRVLDKHLNLQWSYSFDRTVTETESPDFGTIVFDQNTGVVTGAVVGDYRDSVVRPTRGSFWSATVQLAPEKLGSESKFRKLFTQLYAFVPLGHGVIWASGYRVGLAKDYGEPLSLDNGFRAGGPSSVRGFAARELGPVDELSLIPYGGAGLLILNQEIRFPMFWRLRGVGFYDAGNAFAEPSDIALTKLRQSAGIGLRFELPFGLIRVDWARVVAPRPGESPSRWIFTLGHAF